MSFVVRGSAYGIFEKQSLTPDGISNEFTLNYRPGTPGAILVAYDGILQEPEVSYNLINGGRKVAFTFVPDVGTSLYIIYLGRELLVPTGGGGGGGSSSLYNQNVIGLVNGTNTVYTTGSNFALGTTRVFLNGIRLRLLDSYTETGSNQITLTLAPQTGDDLLIDYDLE